MSTPPQTLPPIFLSDDFSEQYYVCWRVEPAVPDEKNNPLLTPKYPWDSGTVANSGGTILRDPIDGKYKGYITCFAGEVTDKLGWEEYNLCYIESEDGIRWERPLFDMWPRPGHPKTNILLDFPSGGRSIQGCVMINPDDDPDEPYEMFAYREPCFKCPSMVVEGMNQTHDVTYEEAEKNGPYNQPGWKYYGIYRHKSKDGIKWRAVEGPLFETGDTCSVFENPGGGYTAHSKVGIPSAPGAPVPHDCYPGQTRTMWRRTSPDGSNWSERTLLITPDWRDQVGDQIMQADRLPYGDGYLCLTSIIHTVGQRIDQQWAASPDGANYWRPTPRTPCLPNPPVGDYGGGMHWPFASPFEIDGRLYAYYGAAAGLHGDIYSQTPHLFFPQNGGLCRASWDMGRFYALVNARGGGLPHAHATTHPVDVTGDRMLLNARTVRDGEIRVELIDGENKPIQGFTMEDCEPFLGNEKFGSVRWKGGSVPQQDKVRVKFYISSGMLYGWMWEKG